MLKKSERSSLISGTESQKEVCEQSAAESACSCKNRLRSAAAIRLAGVRQLPKWLIFESHGNGYGRMDSGLRQISTETARFKKNFITILGVRSASRQVLIF